MAALQKAIRILDYRMRSRAELLERLAEAGHAREAAEYAVRQVVELKLQSDAELADAIVRNKWRTAKWARPRIALALRQRGIGREEAEAALDALFVRGEGIGIVGPGGIQPVPEEAGGQWGEGDGEETALERDLYKAALRQWRRAHALPSCSPRRPVSESDIRGPPLPLPSCTA